MTEIREAEAILLACATQYYIASGVIIDKDGQDGYGPLRDCRLWIEKYGSDIAKAELAKWKRS